MKSPIILGFLLLCLNTADMYPQLQRYILEGKITDRHDGKPLRHVNVSLKETKQGDVTDSSGNYLIRNIKPGSYTLIVSLIGYKKLTRALEIGSDRNFSFLLEEQPLLFQPIEITPGTFSVTIDEPGSHKLTPRQILYTANLFTRDIYRSLQILPGISHNEWSSKPHIKGGNPDETAVILDNLEIFEPFHLDELDGPFSLIGSDLVDEMTVLTGGFSSRHSDKMSGILRINTVDRLFNDSLRFSVDFMGASVNLNQRISDKVEVFTAGRRSYLYLIEKTTDNDYPAEIWDLWNKITYRHDPYNRFALHYLVVKDNVKYSQDSTYIRREFFESEKTNSYLWLNWRRLVSDRYFFLTTAGYQKLGKNSDFSFDANYTSDNKDKRNTHILTARQDHYFNINDIHTLEYGAEFHQFFSDYLYREARINPLETKDWLIATDIMALNRKFTGYRYGAYIQDQWTITDPLKLQFGFRLSGQSYTDHAQLAPRLSASYSFSERLTFKAAYGWYYQPDNMQKLRVYQNQYRLDDKPEKCVHYIGSANYKHSAETEMTLELYYKDYIRLNDDYNYDFFNRISGIGIIDRPYFTSTGYSTGADFFISKKFGHRSLLTAAYSLGFHRISNYASQVTQRDLDRTQLFNINSINQLGRNITFSAIWRFHTGDPYTPSRISILGDSSVTNSTVFFTLDKKNSGRLPAFHTMDLKIEKKWIADRMAWVLYGSVINVYGHDNIRQYYWQRQVENKKIKTFERRAQSFFPRFFLLGLSMELDLPAIVKEQ